MVGWWCAGILSSGISSVWAPRIRNLNTVFIVPHHKLLCRKSSIPKTQFFSMKAQLNALLELSHNRWLLIHSPALAQQHICEQARAHEHSHCAWNAAHDGAAQLAQSTAPERTRAQIKGRNWKLTGFLKDSGWQGWHSRQYRSQQPFLILRADEWRTILTPPAASGR